MKKKLQMGIIILIGILLLGVAILTLKHRQDQKNNVRAAQINACSTDAIGQDLKKDKSILDPSKASLLKPFYDKAEALANHEKSASCIFVLAAYNAYSGDYTKAKANYASLQTLKGQGVQIDSSFKDQSAKLDLYMKNVDNLEKLYKAADNRADPSIFNTKAGTNAH